MGHPIDDTFSPRADEGLLRDRLAALAPHKFRCGDVARIEGTDFDIEVAFADYETGTASWFGWPDGITDISKLTLVSACTDQEHAKCVAQWLDGRGDSMGNDSRPARIERLYRPRAYARRIYELATRRLDEARASYDSAHMAFREALDGPEDV